MISGTFEVPINNGAAWPSPEPSASSSDQRLASRRPGPGIKHFIGFQKLCRRARSLAAVPPLSDTRPEDFHTPPIELFVLPGSTRKGKQESLNTADFLINATFAGDRQTRPEKSVRREMGRLCWRWGRGWKMLPQTRRAFGSGGPAWALHT